MTDTMDIDWARGGDPTARVVAPGTLACIGHSHVSCVAEAAIVAGVPMETVNFWGVPGCTEPAGNAGALRLAGKVTRWLDACPGKVFSFVGGAVHTVVGMLAFPRRIDCVLPEEPTLPLDPRAEVLPVRAVDAVLVERSRQYLALMAQVLTHSRHAMLHVEPPPPSANNERIFHDVEWGMYPADMLHEIAPWPLRYKLWRLHSGILRRWCEAHAVTFVPCPAGCQDEHGCLADTYYLDGAHANAAYGELVLRQLQSCV